MTVRVFNQAELHRANRFDPPTKLGIVVGHTRCEVRFVYGDWPKGHPRPRLPRCAECFA